MKTNYVAANLKGFLRKLVTYHVSQATSRHVQSSFPSVQPPVIYTFYRRNISLSDTSKRRKYYPENKLNHII